MNAITASILLHHYFVPNPKYQTAGTNNGDSDSVTNGYRELIGQALLSDDTDKDAGFNTTDRGVVVLVKFWLACPLPEAAWMVKL